MPYIHKLPSGKWSAVVRHPSGRRQRFTDPMKRVVVQWAAEREAAFRSGTAVAAESGRKMTVERWAVTWQRARNVEPATAAKDASQLRTHLLPKWGAWPLRSIGRLDVQTWVNDMTHVGVGANTVNACYRLLSGMLSDAVLEGLIGASPCREVDLPRVVKPPPRWLTREEYDRIQLALAVTPRGQVWSAYVGLGCFSGLRPGELAGLDVGAVDFDRSLVRVSQVMTRHGLRAYPKSDSSVRSVPFPPEVAEMLWRLVGDRGQGPVFTSPDGGRVDEANYRRRIWRPALEAAGVAYDRPYITRHTCASWLVQKGVPTFEIVKMLGHSSTRLVDTYLHLAPDQHDRIRAAWGQNSYPTSDPRASVVPSVEL